MPFDHNGIAFLIEDDMATLILGYGNKDRQDDGVAWHVLSSLCNTLKKNPNEEIAEEFTKGTDLAMIFQLQLMPEQCEFIATYDRVCFIDAHTGAITEEIRVQPLVQHFQSSPLTHHLSPESLLSITNTIYNKSPESVLLSIRGYEFGFSQNLSDRTQLLVPQAVNLILEWLDKKTSK